MKKSKNWDETHLPQDREPQEILKIYLELPFHSQGPRVTAIFPHLNDCRGTSQAGAGGRRRASLTARALPACPCCGKERSGQVKGMKR